MGSGLGGGPVVGTGGGPSSSQHLAGIGGSGANSSATSGIQAPQTPGNPQEDNRKRGRDDDSASEDAPARPPSKKFCRSGTGLNAAVQAPSPWSPSIGQERFPYGIKRMPEDEDSENSVIIDESDGEETQPESPPLRKRTRRAGAGTQANLQFMGVASTQNVESTRNSRHSNSSSRQSQAGRGPREKQGQHQGQNAYSSHRNAPQTQTEDSFNSNVHGRAGDMYPDPGLYELGGPASRSANNQFDTPYQDQQAVAYNSLSTLESAGMLSIDPALYGCDEPLRSTQYAGFGQDYQAQGDSFAQSSRGFESSTMTCPGHGGSQTLYPGRMDGKTYRNPTQSGGNLTQRQSMNGFSEYPYGMNDGGSSIHGYTRNPSQQDENTDDWSVPEIPEDGSDACW